MSDEKIFDKENENNIAASQETADEVKKEEAPDTDKTTLPEETEEIKDEAVAAEDEAGSADEDFEIEIYDEASEEVSEEASEEATEEASEADFNSTSSYEWNPTEKTDIPEAKKKKSGKGFKVFVAVMLTVFTLSSLLLCAMVAVNILPDSAETSKKQEAQESFDYNSVVLDKQNYVTFDFKEHDGKALSIPEIAAKCTPSSVGIISEIQTTYSYPFYFAPETRVAQASGSGFIYSADGYIITNHHVIENASKIKVILHDNTEYEAELIGSDELSDIAVLKITPKEDVTLIPMEMGSSDELVVGEEVVAIGCPAGIEFIGTVTDGIISAINRNVEIKDSYGDVKKTMTLIQTNATINHGNSGGPLINTKGQVIGINTLKLSANYEGIGFSIPISGAKPIISQIIEYGKVIERTEEDFAYSKGIIGINGSEISESESEYYGIPRGVLVVQINREGSAARAGLRRGDIITHYDGKEVKNIDDINAMKGDSRAGTEVTLTVYRDGDSGEGETLDITFKLDAQ